MYVPIWSLIKSDSKKVSAHLRSPCKTAIIGAFVPAGHFPVVAGGVVGSGVLVVVVGSAVVVVGSGVVVVGSGVVELVVGSGVVELVVGSGVVELVVGSGVVLDVIAGVELVVTSRVVVTVGQRPFSTQHL